MCVTNDNGTLICGKVGKLCQFKFVYGLMNSGDKKEYVMEDMVTKALTDLSAYAAQEVANNPQEVSTISQDVETTEETKNVDMKDVENRIKIKIRSYISECNKQANICKIGDKDVSHDCILQGKYHMICCRPIKGDKGKQKFYWLNPTLEKITISSENVKPKKEKKMKKLKNVEEEKNEKCDNENAEEKEPIKKTRKRPQKKEVEISTSNSNVENVVNN